MKKIILFAALAATTVLSSCGYRAPKADLKTAADTVSYEAGLVISNQAQMMLVQEGLDSAFVDEFLKGAAKGLEMKGNKKEMAALLGQIFGFQNAMQLEGLKEQLFADDSTVVLSSKNFLSAVAAALNDTSYLMVDSVVVTPEMADRLLMDRIVEKRFAGEKEANAKFVEEYAKNDSVQKLPCGVLYKVIKAGKGAIPTENSVVSVRYTGRLINGNIFDTTGEGEPREFAVGAVIKGWTEALKVMPVGSKWEICVPYELGYGKAGQRSIPPYATLIFEVELLGAK